MQTQTNVVESGSLNCSLTCLMSGNISSSFSEKKSKFIGEAPAPPSMLVIPDSSGVNWLFSRSSLVRPFSTMAGKDRRRRVWPDKRSDRTKVLVTKMLIDDIQKNSFKNNEGPENTAILLMLINHLSYVRLPHYLLITEHIFSFLY